MNQNQPAVEPARRHTSPATGPTQLLPRRAHPSGAPVAVSRHGVTPGETLALCGGWICVLADRIEPSRPGQVPSIALRLTGTNRHGVAWQVPLRPWHWLDLCPFLADQGPEQLLPRVSVADMLDLQLQAVTWAGERPARLLLALTPPREL